LIHGLGAVIFVALNLLLIPMFFHIGSSIAVLISFFFLFILEIYWSRKIIKNQLAIFISEIYFNLFSWFVNEYGFVDN